MRVKFILTTEIPLHLDPQAHQYWATLLQEAINRWRRKYREEQETAIDSFTVEPYKPDEMGIGQVDIDNPQLVEIQIDNTGQKVWVNVNGFCAFRAHRIQTLTVHDDHKHRGYTRGFQPHQHLEEVPTPEDSA